MDIVKKDDRYLILNKNNIMIKAKYNLNTIETKLYLNILYNLQKYLNNTKFDINGNDDISISIDRVEFKELVPGIQYLEPAKLIKLFGGLRSKNIYYKLNSKWEVFGFIEKASYNSKTDTVVIKMDRFIADMLLNYKDSGYTPLNMALMFGLEGMYSYRLYELIRLWSNTKDIITYSVDELKEYFMLEDKTSYNKYNNFKTKVILPAINELNDLKIFEIQIEENKVGKRVISIDFIVKDLDKRKYFDNPKDLIYKKDNYYLSNTTDTDVIENKVEKIEIKDFYVPNKKLFTARTLENFKNDFKNYDFKDDKYKKLLQESILIALDTDDEEKIKVKSYNYFKKILENKIENNKSKNNGTNYVKTRFHNINQSFSNYDENELEKMLLENQKNKFK